MEPERARIGTGPTELDRIIKRQDAQNAKPREQQQAEAVQFVRDELFPAIFGDITPK